MGEIYIFRGSCTSLSWGVARACCSAVCFGFAALAGERTEARRSNAIATAYRPRSNTPAARVWGAFEEGFVTFTSTINPTNGVLLTLVREPGRATLSRVRSAVYDAIAAEQHVTSRRSNSMLSDRSGLVLCCAIGYSSVGNLNIGSGFPTMCQRNRVCRLGSNINRDMN